MPLLTSDAPTAGRTKLRAWQWKGLRAAGLLLLTLLGCMLGLLLLDESADPLPAQLFRALWNAANTISTLGDLDSLNHAQKAFMIGAMFTLLSVGGYAISTLTGVLSSDEVLAYREYRRMDKILATLSGHVVVAGFGPVGRRVAGQLRQQGRTVVVIEFDPARARAASDQGYLTVLLQAGRDEVLAKARLDTAESMVVLIDDIDRKLVLTLIARGINPTLTIVVTDDSDAGESWLPHAGASQVVLVDDLVARSLVDRLTRRPGPGP
jgi:voltage-gated potassium channel